MRILSVSFFCFLLSTLGPKALLGHCQIPCGIYDDPLRVRSMLEDVATLEKSMKEIEILSGKRSRSALEENQLVRWVMNKEEHAERTQDTVLHYFLAQRVKPAEGSDEKAYRKYIRQLEVLHSIVLKAMQAKQTVDPEVVRSLRAAVLEFAELYLSAAEYGKLGSVR